MQTSDVTVHLVREFAMREELANEAAEAWQNASPEELDAAVKAADSALHRANTAALALAHHMTTLYEQELDRRVAEVNR
jgi:hypothetical protein